MRPGLIDALVAHPGIGFVLVDGEVLGDLTPFGPHAAEHVARTNAFPHCPDIMVNSRYWEDMDEVAAFEELVGSHGGLGGGQAHPFVLAPPDLAWPEGEVIGAEAVHRIFRGWLAGLGHDAYKVERVARRDRLHPRRRARQRRRELQRRVAQHPRVTLRRGRSAGRCPSGSGSRSPAGRSRSPRRAAAGSRCPGPSDGPQPQIGISATSTRPRSASISGLRSVSPANQMPSTR